MTAASAALDPDLQALPKPRRPWRRLTLTVMAITALASALLFLDLVSLAGYALRDGRPTDIGPLTDVQLGARLENQWVRAEGQLADRGAAYQRPLDSDRYRLVPVEARPNVWVELRVPEGIAIDHYLPPASFVGRLVPLGELGLRYAPLESAMESAQRGKAPGKIWVLIDGQSPATARWALAVAGLAIAFFLFNLWGLVHLLRPVRK